MDRWASRKRPYAITFFAVLASLLAVLSYVILRPFFEAIAWAIVLAVALRPIWVRIEARFRKRRSLAAAVTSLLVALLVLLPAGLVVAALAGQAGQTASRFIGFLRRGETVRGGDLTSIPVLGGAVAWVQQNTGITSETVKQHAAQAVAKLSSVLAAAGGGAVIGFLGGVMTFLLTMVLLFFLLRDGEAMADAISEMLPLSVDERRKAMRRLEVMLQSIFRGSLLTAVFQGALGGIGWALVGHPSAFLAGAAMAVLSLLPIGGTALVWIPGAIALALQGRTGAAIFLFLWGVIVVATADNVLKPLLIKGGGELTTLVVFLGVFGGIAAFGLLGLFIGPIVLATAQTLIETMRRAARREDEQAAGDEASPAG
ncbi:MAG: AI-2E family transporter [Thermoanaerobaculia bacterium]